MLASTILDPQILKAWQPLIRSYFQTQKWAVLDVGGQKDGPMPGIASGESDPAKLVMLLYLRNSACRVTGGDAQMKVAIVKAVTVVTAL